MKSGGTVNPYTGINTIHSSKPVIMALGENRPEAGLADPETGTFAVQPLDVKQGASKDTIDRAVEAAVPALKERAYGPYFNPDLNLSLEEQAALTPATLAAAAKGAQGMYTQNEQGGVSPLSYGAPPVRGARTPGAPPAGSFNMTNPYQARSARLYAACVALKTRALK